MKKLIQYKRPKPQFQKNYSSSRKKSRTVVLFTILISLTLCIGAVAITSYNIVEGLLLNSLTQQALLKAERGRDDIDQWLATRKTEIKTLANSPLVQSLDWSVMEPYLQTEIKRLQTYLLMAMVTPEGALINTQGGRPNVKDREFFNRSMAGETVAADPIIGRTSGKLQIQVSSPIPVAVRGNSTVTQPAGVLMGGIPINRVVEVISSLHQGDNSYAFALNSKGVPIAHPDVQLIGTPEKPADSFLNSTNSKLAAIAQQMVAQQTNIERVQIDNTWNYVAYTPLKEANWSVALIVPQVNIESPLRALHLLAVVLSSLLVVGLIGAWRQVQMYEQIRNRARFASQQAQQLSEALKELHNTQAQLLQTEKMSSLGQLVAGVAHEINNPINFIHGNLNYVSEYSEGMLKLLTLYQQSYPDPPPQIRHHLEDLDIEFLVKDLPQLVESMRGGTDRIRQIVLSLRTFSRMDEADLKAVNLHEGLDSTLMILEHRLKFRTDYPAVQVLKKYGDLPLIECFAGQLNQVFMNILTNALDALEERDAQRTIQEVEQVPSQILIQTSLLENQRVRICIADNGPGIPKHLQQQLFNPFFTTKSVGKGTGMGLSISYQIVVEQHKGSLRCFSEPGQGSEFWIEVPSIRSAAE